MQIDIGIIHALVIRYFKLLYYMFHLTKITDLIYSIQHFISAAGQKTNKLFYYGVGSVHFLKS